MIRNDFSWVSSAPMWNTTDSAMSRRRPPANARTKHSRQVMVNAAHRLVCTLVVNQRRMLVVTIDRPNSAARTAAHRGDSHSCSSNRWMATMAHHDTARPNASAAAWCMPSGPTMALLIVHSIGEKCSKIGCRNSERDIVRVWATRAKMKSSSAKYVSRTRIHCTTMQAVAIPMVTVH